MKLFGLLRKLIRDYFIIFGILIIGTALLSPSQVLDRDYVLLAMAFSAVGDLPSILFWSRSELTESAMRLRIALHFILLELVVLICGGISGIVFSFTEYVTLGVEVAIIYVLVRFISWRGDLNTANRINEKLKSFKVNDEDD